MAKVIGFVGYSGSGKTTLISKVLPILIDRNCRVAVIKHDAHGHYKEVSGADSSLFIQQGADSVITVSPESIHFYEKKQDAGLEELIAGLSAMDYILIEGFKMETHPKIAVYRDEQQKSILRQLALAPIAVATDLEQLDSPYAVLDLNDPEAIADFIQAVYPES